MQSGVSQLAGDGTKSAKGDDEGQLLVATIVTGVVFSLVSAYVRLAHAGVPSMIGDQYLRAAIKISFY